LEVRLSRDKRGEIEESGADCVHPSGVADLLFDDLQRARHVPALPFEG
jgi:hypothetical protein